MYHRLKQPPYPSPPGNSPPSTPFFGLHNLQRFENLKWLTQQFVLVCVLFSIYFRVFEILYCTLKGLSMGCKHDCSFDLTAHNIIVTCNDCFMCSNNILLFCLFQIGVFFLNLRVGFFWTLCNHIESMYRPLSQCNVCVQVGTSLLRSRLPSTPSCDRCCRVQRTRQPNNRPASLPTPSSQTPASTRKLTRR